jgi:hypothetical protein
MEPIKTTYQFKNKVTAEFTYQKSAMGPTVNCVWSCAFVKKNIAPIWDEYVNKCIPRVYQELANRSGEGILWVDKTGKHGFKFFKPTNS